MNHFKYIKYFYHKLVFFFCITISTFNTAANANEVSAGAVSTPPVASGTQSTAANTLQKEHLQNTPVVKENVAEVSAGAVSTPPVASGTQPKAVNKTRKKHLHKFRAFEENVAEINADAVSTHEGDTDNKEFKTIANNVLLEESDSLDIINKKVVDLLDKHRNKIIDLEHGCISDKKHIICGSIHTNSFISKNTDAQFNLGYFFNENVSMGLNLSSSLPNFPLENYSQNSDLGVGIYAIFTLPFRNTPAYLKPIITFNDYRLENNNTLSKDLNWKEKSLDGNSQSINMMLKFGQKLPLPYGIDFDWYIAGGHMNISQNISEEKHDDLIVLNQKINYPSTVGYLGANVNIPLIEDFKWKLGVNIIHDFNMKEPLAKLSVAHLHDFAKNSLKLAQTRSNISSGLSYKVNKNLELSILPSINFPNLKNYDQWQGALAIHISGHF